MSISLQRCTACGRLQYPRRDVCGTCLADTLEWIDDTGHGSLLAATTLHRSLDETLRQTLPQRIGTVRLDAGPHLLAFLEGETAPGDRVAVRRLASGEFVAIRLQ